MPVPHAAHAVSELLTMDEKRPKYSQRCYKKRTLKVAFCWFNTRFPQMDRDADGLESCI